MQNSKKVNVLWETLSASGEGRVVMIMSLRDGDLPAKQSPVSRGDCFATCARNDMQDGAPQEAQSRRGHPVRAKSPSRRNGLKVCSAKQLLLLVGFPSGVDIVPDLVDKLRVNSARGRSSILDKAFNPYRVLRKGEL